MPGNSFGQLFRITTFGESHGRGIGVVIDGCPPQLTIDRTKIAFDLRRRRPGQSALTTARSESEEFEIVSGILDNVTTGAPLTIWIPNKDARSKDYGHLEGRYRPSHADFAYEQKYGIRDVRGGGRSSARETAARVAAGSIAKQLLDEENIEILAYVCQVGELRLNADDANWTLEQVEASPVRCPDTALSREMEDLILTVRDHGDTVGGCVECVVRDCPAGLGEPVFDKLHADLGKAMLSINAAKGFEIGSGFRGAEMRGSAHNDPFLNEEGEIRTATNYSGGVQGGISNGMEIVFRTAFKPVSTLMQTQTTVDAKGNTVELEGKGRHDPCVVPRAVPIVEAMAALVVADHLLRHHAMRALS